nr:unnamed protein product [Timema bartmani]CAD7585658.1 unnamed protein product [Timema genevievae]
MRLQRARDRPPSILWFLVFGLTFLVPGSLQAPIIIDTSDRPRAVILADGGWCYVKTAVVPVLFSAPHSVVISALRLRERNEAFIKCGTTTSHCMI